VNSDRAAGSPSSLSFVGAGRAASALAVAARAAGYEIAAVTGRDPKRTRRLAELVGARVAGTALAAARAADVTVIAVPDQAVPGVAATLAASGMPLRGRALVHTAARLGPEALAAARLTTADIGVLHPLQALSGPASAALLHSSYFRVEAEPPLRVRLETLVAALGGHVIAVPADARAVYHAAAVLAGNAPVTLLAAAEQVLASAGVDRVAAHDALGTLLAGAAANALQAGARTALTGPVARGDAAAIAAHLHSLRDDPAAYQLYLTLARETARLAGQDPVALGVDRDDTAAPVIRRVA
jgi:predicted short-subunit dehydrogenase-like oxidoreductase (DUF2520 family)